MYDFYQFQKAWLAEDKDSVSQRASIYFCSDDCNNKVSDFERATVFVYIIWFKTESGISGII